MTRWARMRRWLLSYAGNRRRDEEDCPAFLPPDCHPGISPAHRALLSFFLFGSLLSPAIPGRCASVSTDDGLALDFRDADAAVTGDLVNLRPEEERAVILYFRLPVDASPTGSGSRRVPGARWGRNLGVEEPVRPGRRYLNGTEFHQAYRPAMSRLPIATLSGAGWGLSMAQPMDVPRFFRLAYQEPYGLQMEYEIGLSPITWKFRNRAPFQFLLYRHDPAWGLRSGF